MYYFCNPLLAIEADFLYSRKDNPSFLDGIQCIVVSFFDIVPGKKFCSALAYQNIARLCKLAAVEFYSQPF